MGDVFRKNYRELSVDETRRIERLKTEAEALYATIEQGGPSREASIAKTKLEEVVFWATKAITAS